MTAEHRPDPCTQEARDEGCTCHLPYGSRYDIDPPEPVVRKDCPLHGWEPDPDYLRDRAIDDALTFRDNGWDREDY